MITRSARDGTDAIDFVLRPNGALGWRRAKRACAVLFTISAVIAGGFAMHGAWLVLPFAGVEMALLATALYLACRWSGGVEVLRVEPTRVTVLRARGREAHTFPRAWLQVRLLRDPRGWYPSRLQLRSHGRAVEVGARLVEEERLELAEELARLARVPAVVDPVHAAPAPSPRPRSVAT